MIRILFFILVCLAAFAFPWQYAALLIFIASLYLPVLGIAFGLIYDALYYVHGFPYATIAGALGALIAFGIAQFVRTRVIDFSR